MDNLFLLGGLPRSGITVLSSLLNQNPNVYVTTTSPFVEILWRNFSLWNDDEYKCELSTDSFQSLKVPFLNKVTESFYSGLTEAPTVIDKRRQWQSPANIEMYKEVYGVLPKIICPVRDVADIIVSYMQVFERNGIMWNYGKLMKGNKFEHSFYQLKEAFESEFSDCLHLVEYNDLVDKPNETLDGIYKFLGMDSFKHSFDIKAHEKEANFNLDGLHDLRPKLARTNVPNSKYLSEKQINEYNKKIFWRS